jgi:phosphate acetyltransferase
VNINNNILKFAKNIGKKKRIILPESFDTRVLNAATMIVRDNIASVILPTNNKKKLINMASSIGIDLSEIEIVNIDIEILDKNKIDEFLNARKEKKSTDCDKINLFNDYLYFSMMYLKSGKCDACVCGAAYDTADVLRASFSIIGTSKNVKIVSSYFIMVPPIDNCVIKYPVIFADCAVNPEPNVFGLRDIAVSSVESFRKTFPNRNINVSMLSFSTKGSSNSKSLLKIKDATDLVKNYFKNLNDNIVNVDGELQFDASIIQNIGHKKAPNSQVAGNANVLIFPDLNSGNIGYKIAERLGRFTAIGPILQGLLYPVSDLSRGSSSEDIYLTSAIVLNHI